MSTIPGCSATIGFTLPAGAQPGDRPLVVLAGGPDGAELVRALVRRAGSDPAEREWDDVRQNYLRWAGADGTAAVLEVVFANHRAPAVRADQPGSFRIGVPLALLGAGAHLVHLRLRPGKAELIVDGRLVDEEWPSGALPALPAAVTGVQVWPRWLDDAELGVQPEAGVVAGTLGGSELQYWAPPGHNRWLGDTMMLWDGRRLHLLYLLDRRHHGSKAGTGAHQIAHLSTTDLRTWEVHPLALAIEEPWETFGTGAMLHADGRWHLVYGLHTDRIIERGAVDNGRTTALPCAFDRLDGLPMGTALAVSEDGVHFRRTGELVHAAQNPSALIHPEGGFAMFAGYGAEGLHRSDDLRTWRPVDAAIIPEGKASPVRNSTECICHLAWNGWHYLIGGRTGFWMARSFAGPYWDRDGTQGEAVVQPRWDIYDGLWVPMVAALGDGRRILSGWLEDRGGWAGCLVLRELVQGAARAGAGGGRHAGDALAGRDLAAHHARPGAALGRRRLAAPGFRRGLGGR